jgi:tRNA pseudouridine13 synthase
MPLAQKDPPAIEELSERFSFLTDTEPIQGGIKRGPQDFLVEELSHYPPEHEDGDFTIIELQLTNWETNRAIKKLTKKLRISRARVGFGGTKDKRAVTRQLISIRGRDIDIDRIQMIKDMEVIKHYLAKRPMRMGDLKGNRFTIKVAGTVSGDLERAKRTMEAVLNEKGFPNYFGPQRFGTLRPITHLVGKHLTLGDFGSAVKTYIGMPFDGEPEEVQEARKLAEDESILGEALKAFPNDYTFERSIIHYLLSNPGDHVGAIDQLPKNLSLMFIHAYQSHLFNRTLSERLSQGHELKPLMGDRILPVGKDGLPQHGDGIMVNEMNIDKMRRKCEEGKAFVSGLVFGTEVELAEGMQGEVERKIIKEELGDIDRSRFVIPQLPRLTTKGTRRELLAPVKNSSIGEEKDSLVMEFELNKGCYATSLLREFFKK